MIDRTMPSYISMRKEQSILELKLTIANHVMYL